MLHDVRPELVFDYEANTSNLNQIKYTCKCKVDNFEFKSDELTSKKAAKQNLADKILSTLYSSTYKKPSNVDDINVKQKIERITKILDFNSLKSKSASQLLNEIDSNLGKCGDYELDLSKENSFCYKIQITETHCIRGYGRNKKQAKNEASKLVIKELFNIDINEILSVESQGNDSESFSTIDDIVTK